MGCIAGAGRAGRAEDGRGAAGPSAGPGSARLTLGGGPRRLNPDEMSRNSTLLPNPKPAFHGSGALAFSTKGEYGVRLMVQLGRHYGMGPASLAEIAAEEDLPRAYLEQLVTSLRDSGLVVSTRGARGGYELARPPLDIGMGDILRALEGPIAPMFCASDDPVHATTCDRSARCTVNVLWVRVRDAVTGALDSMTLADLVPLPGTTSVATTSTATLTGAVTPS